MNYVTDVQPGCPNPGSPRIRFQWNCLSDARGEVLNVGSCNDPAGIGARAIHFDYDDWSEHFCKVGVAFQQGDAHRLDQIYTPKRFDLVILGDMLEHVIDPHRVIEAACRVSRSLCMTVWVEWRKPGAGIWLKETRKRMDAEADEAGYATYEDMYEALHPEVKVMRRAPHLDHIWQFTDENAGCWLYQLECEGFEIIHATKELEVVHEGIPAYNFLVYARRPGGRSLKE